MAKQKQKGSKIMRSYKSPLDTAKDLSENVPSASLVSHIVPFRKEGMITKLE